MGIGTKINERLKAFAIKFVKVVKENRTAFFVAIFYSLK